MVSGRCKIQCHAYSIFPPSSASGREQRTEWHRIECWGTWAEYAGAFKKGAFVMPTDLFLIGAVLAVVAGGLMFVLINRSKPADPPRFLEGRAGWWFASG
jgi:hypothetical protein